ncbi:hypothetical protein COL154_004900 [Colletotrichum chrysophilum]|uniref:uncharacterized protein n=1 Tax=Colletotrichum chrysophilum TaxID=1836956 RepID=UPI0023004C2F|nr:uncharacterized protein COL26b_004178 [Colletotrichum chrysophilum]KAJ0350624.1 hypothetical protein KNSL1_003781 [Colletotrichum chrysophilum]KAJ0364521.1 hypothetical protein COL154_004900 [Colletotrichum chrysophilum]KAJ0377472.1 hypothetical protein COL26b_004178 [Colletotrichum chrysophilum]
MANTGVAQKGFIQYTSDLHLEAGNQYSTFDFPAMSPYLLIAGDVGSLADYEEYLVFVRRQTNRFEGVVLVLGNHEFHGLDYDSAIERARQLETEPSLEGKLHILHRDRFDIPGSLVTILGCTLWSLVPDEARAAVTAKVKDFEHIEAWTVDDHNEAHLEDVTWLRRELGNVPEERSVIVVTHHAPSMEGTSEPRHSGSIWSSAFATDLLGAGGWERVRRWVFGHTHYSTDEVVQGVRLLSNQRGYVREGGVAKDGFNPGRVIALIENEFSDRPKRHR